MLRLEVQNCLHSTVLRCTGRIVHGGGADILLRTVMFQDVPHIQIDLSGVSSIDAGGLGILAELERLARDGKRTLHLVNPSHRVREALETTGLNSVLQILPAADQERQTCQMAAYATDTEGGSVSMRPQP